MTSTTYASLPPGWTPDESLKPSIPASHDYRTFQRLPENPARYAASVLGAGIFDIFQSRFLSPTSTGVNDRRRYRLNLGPNTKPIRLFYARIVCALAFGHAPTASHEAHHVDGNRTNDVWINLRWQTPKQNRAIEVERNSSPLSVKYVIIPYPDCEYDPEYDVGDRDKRYRMDSGVLSIFISDYDQDINQGRTPDLKRHARFHGVSVRQLQRIIAGKTRQAEVKSIRSRPKEIEAEAPISA